MTLAARLAAAAAPLLLAACTTVHGTPLPMSEPVVPKSSTFAATGEIRSTIGKSCAFDAWHLQGPRVNLTRLEDGSWEGTAGPNMHPLHLEVTPGMVRGSGVNLSIERMADGFVEVGGLFYEDRYLVRISPERLTGKTHGGRCGFDFKRVSPNVFYGDLACGMDVTRVGIEFLGAAARADQPVLPQVAIALIAVMP